MSKRLKYKTEKIEEMRELLIENPKIGNRQGSRLLQMPRSTFQLWRKEIQERRLCNESNSILARNAE